MIHQNTNKSPGQDPSPLMHQERARELFRTKVISIFDSSEQMQELSRTRRIPIDVSELTRDSISILMPARNTRLMCRTTSFQLCDYRTTSFQEVIQKFPSCVPIVQLQNNKLPRVIQKFPNCVTAEQQFSNRVTTDQQTSICVIDMTTSMRHIESLILSTSDQHISICRSHLSKLCHHQHVRNSRQEL